MSGKSLVAAAIAIGPAIVVGRMVGRQLGKLSYCVAHSAARVTGENECTSDAIANGARQFSKIIGGIGASVMTYNAITGLFR